MKLPYPPPQLYFTGPATLWYLGLETCAVSFTDDFARSGHAQQIQLQKMRSLFHD